MGILEIKDIHTYYGDSHVLQGVTLNIERGDVVALLGRNGAGKTTLVHTIIGFNPPRSGKIFFDGADITYLKTHLIARLGIGLIPQGRRVFRSLTVNENLGIATRPGQTLNFSMDDVYSLFPNLRARYRSRGKNLSGGEQQMLACGRALVGNPSLLMLDEPSEGLAPLLVREVEGVIKKIKAEGLSILLVEQNFSFALGLADYVYVMNRGAVVHESPPEILKKNNEIKSKYLGL
jgi:branched-chain amino acid transport system ATP-binding protein